MAQVELRQVTKVYPGGVRAVDAVDLHIGDREFVVLVGPSGCGKTTTLRMIAGLEEITGGTIQIGDRIVNDVPPKDRDIAMVFQNYALYPHMTVYKNMAFGLKLRKMPRDQINQRVMEAAKTLEIEHLMDRKPKALSGGQKQRVAVGRAIVREPAAFLFDEPLSNLDAKLRVTTRAELKRLHQRLRTTTVYVTHDQEEAMTLGDRIVAMKDGRVQQADTPLNMYNKPVNRFVAGFIGMPPMNFFDGALRVVDGQMIFEEGSLVCHPLAPCTHGERAGVRGVASNDLASPESLEESPLTLTLSPAYRGEGTRAGNSPAELTLPGNGFRLTIPARLRDALAGRVGQHVVLGVRPEHLHLRPTEQEGATGSPLTLKVSVVEPLGNDMDVYAETAAGHRVVARVEAAEEYGRTSGDSEVKMFVDLRKIHVFEPGETGMNLSLTTPREPAHAIA